MRWPLRNQILAPMGGLMLLTLLGVSAMNAHLSLSRFKRQIEGQLREMTQTLADSSFPLTDSVLRQMRGLSGAEFVLVNDSGDYLASSRTKASFPRTLPAVQLQNREQLALGDVVRLGDGRYFHAAVELRRRNAVNRQVLLHIFYPEHVYREAWWHAVYPPLAVGGLALFLVIVFGIAIAAYVSRPLRRLQGQVDHIAQGDFEPLPLARRDDEVLDLAKSVNHMAETLALYEGEVRRSEKLRTLGQLGGGIAHQMRNSVTGCRMALDLHRRECPLHDHGEALEVAVRQLTLMEEYLRRFLSLGHSRRQAHRRVDLAPLIENVLPLVLPAARHVGVELQCRLPDAPQVIEGDAEALQQLLVNLLLNAIDAASRCDEPESRPPEPGLVVVEVRRDGEQDVVLLEVRDTGAGPAAHVRETLFDPLVTEKVDGTGLGLSIAREIAEQHGGKIGWTRRDAMTCFTVELPVSQREDAHVEVAGG